MKSAVGIFRFEKLGCDFGTTGPETSGISERWRPQGDYRSYIADHAKTPLNTRNNEEFLVESTRFARCPQLQYTARRSNTQQGLVANLVRPFQTKRGPKFPIGKLEIGLKVGSTLSRVSDFCTWSKSQNLYRSPPTASLRNVHLGHIKTALGGA